MGFWQKLDAGITAAADWIGDKWNRITGKSSAHQIEMEDMKNAGLNPVMSAGGSSVGSSSGNLVSSAASLGSSLFSGVSSVINSAARLTNNKNIDRQTTEQIYSSAGKLMRTVETYTRDLAKKR